MLLSNFFQVVIVKAFLFFSSYFWFSFIQIFLFLIGARIIFLIWRSDDSILPFFSWYVYFFSSSPLLSWPQGYIFFFILHGLIHQFQEEITLLAIWCMLFHYLCVYCMEFCLTFEAWLVPPCLAELTFTCNLFLTFVLWFSCSFCCPVAFSLFCHIPHHKMFTLVFFYFLVFQGFLKVGLMLCVITSLALQPKSVLSKS